MRRDLFVALAHEPGHVLGRAYDLSHSDVFSDKGRVGSEIKHLEGEIPISDLRSHDLRISRIRIRDADNAASNRRKDRLSWSLRKAEIDASVSLRSARSAKISGSAGVISDRPAGRI